MTLCEYLNPKHDKSKNPAGILNLSSSLSSVSNAVIWTSAGDSIVIDIWLNPAINAFFEENESGFYQLNLTKRWAINSISDVMGEGDFVESSVLKTGVAFCFDYISHSISDSKMEAFLKVIKSVLDDLIESEWIDETDYEYIDGLVVLKATIKIQN